MRNKLHFQFLFIVIVFSRYCCVTVRAFTYCTLDFLKNTVDALQFVILFIYLFIIFLQCDLEDEREVSYQEGKKIAANFSCPFFETSAKNDIGVDEVFRNLARQMKESRAESTRKAFMRERCRFSLRKMSLRKRTCKEKLQAFRLSETPSSDPIRRQIGVFRSFIHSITKTLTLKKSINRER